jgi:hypothetical protein
VGEVWRYRPVVPGQPTQTYDVVVVARGTGSFWSLTVRHIDTGREALWVDASYFHHVGQLTFVRNTEQGETGMAEKRRTFAQIHTSIIVACDTLIQCQQELQALNESRHTMAKVDAAVAAARVLKEEVQ